MAKPHLKSLMCIVHIMRKFHCLLIQSNDVKASNGAA